MPGRIVTTLLLAVPQGPALAQNAEAIVVTGRGLDDSPATPAYGSQVLGADRLTNSASGRLEDSLRTIAGLQQFRRSDSRSANPSAQGVTLRALAGNATSRTLVLLDAVPITDPFFGYVPFNALAPDRLASARITRGGGSGAFGSGAVAGTIELTSAGPAELGLARAAMSANQRGESEFSALIAPSLGAGHAVIAVRRDSGRGFWTTPQDQRVPASTRARQESWSASIQGVIPVGEQAELQARVLAYDDRRTLRFAGADSRSSGQDASLRLVSRGEWQVDLLGYVQARDFSNIVVSATSFRRTLNQRATPSTGLGGKLELRPPIGQDKVLRLGIDLRLVRGRIMEEAINPSSGQVTILRTAGGRNSDLGLFLEHDWTVGALVLTAGARADRWRMSRGRLVETTPAGMVVADTRFPRRAGWTPSFRGGVLWHASPKLALRAAGYTGLRQPTLNELYRPFVVFPVTTRANAGLRNERLRGYEAGLDWRPAGDAVVSLTLFDNRLRHAIANITLGPNLRERRNVDAITARGVEADACWRIGAVTLGGSLAATRARVSASGIAAALDGMRPAQTAAWSASGRISWEPRPGMELTAIARHTGRQFEDDLESDALRPATTLDAFAQVPLSTRFSAVLRGENLANARVVTRNQAGSIDLGVPRTIWAGIRMALP